MNAIKCLRNLVVWRKLDIATRKLTLGESFLQPMEHSAGNRAVIIYELVYLFHSVRTTFGMTNHELSTSYANLMFQQPINKAGHCRQVEVYVSLAGFALYVCLSVWWMLEAPVSC